MSLQLRTSTCTFLYKLLWFISTWFNLRRPIRWWTTDCWRGPSIAPVTSTRGTGTWMWSANVSTISATLPSREYQTQPSQTRPISSLLISLPYPISTSPISNFPCIFSNLPISTLPAISDSTNLRHTRFQTLYIPNSPCILICTAYKCFTTQLVRIMPKTFHVAMYQYNKK